MSRHLVWSGVLVAAGLLVAFAFLWPPSNEPTYAGQQFSRWLMSLDDTAPGFERAVNQAMKTMGTNLLPCLLEMMQSQDTRAGIFVRPWARGFSAQAKRNRATAAIVALGEQAQPILPQLVALTHDSAVGPSAWIALSGMLPEAIQRITAGIVSTNETESMWAETALHLAITREAGEQVFLQCLKHSDRRVRIATLDIVVSRKWDAAAIVPAIIECAKASPDPELRLAAVRQLRGMGQRANGALPMLLGCLDDPDYAVRRAVTNALPIIASEAASRAQIPTKARPGPIPREGNEERGGP